MNDEIQDLVTPSEPEVLSFDARQPAAERVS